MLENQIKISILFFASIKDKSGCSSMELFVPSGLTIQALKRYLIKNIPALDPALFHAISSINMQFADNDEKITGGVEIAFFPPVSGGGEQIEVYLTYEPIDINQLVLKISGKETGGICIFTGIVREVSGDLVTTLLEYQAYAPMAEQKMRQIGEEIIIRWPKVQRVVLLQKLGKIPPPLPSTVILCAAAHRDDGIFEAAQYGIERLKQIAPIWKKEMGPDRSEWMEGGYHPVPGE
jgi:molybdopterin synthase catalytic subunit/molybdopterin converting factor small subunit